MERGKLIIIPDERQIMQDVFSEEVRSNHLNEIQHFSDKYQLGYQFQPGDYQDAPCMIARDGHLVYKTVEDSSAAIFYLPQEITDRQITWMYDNKSEIEKYQISGGYAITNSDNETGFEAQEIETFNELFNLAIKRNFVYQMKGNDEENVRGKNR